MIELQWKRVNKHDLPDTPKVKMVNQDGEWCDFVLQFRVVEEGSDGYYETSSWENVEEAWP